MSCTQSGPFQHLTPKVSRYTSPNSSSVSPRKEEAARGGSSTLLIPCCDERLRSSAESSPSSSSSPIWGGTVSSHAKLGRQASRGVAVPSPLQPVLCREGDTGPPQQDEIPNLHVGVHVCTADTVASGNTRFKRMHTLVRDGLSVPLRSAGEVATQCGPGLNPACLPHSRYRRARQCCPATRPNSHFHHHSGKIVILYQANISVSIILLT